MKGLELAKAYFEQYGKPMLQTQFGDIYPYLAIGLVGSGSECYGYDDELSVDHDFEPCFCIFVPNHPSITDKIIFQLERAYNSLPSEFGGVRKSPLAPVGNKRHGVISIRDFYMSKVGKVGNLNIQDWFLVPEFSLLEATNGEVFEDNFGEFSAIRESLRYYPEDVRLKKIAGNLLLMGQSGQYNYARCVTRGENASGQLAIVEFVKACMQTIFLLNRKYMPYYKWSFKALRELEKLSDLASNLEYLITSPNTNEHFLHKQDVVEKIAKQIINELKAQNISQNLTNELEQHAYSVNNRIKDANLRNENIFYGV